MESERDKRIREKTVSHYDYLIKSLKDPEEALGYVNAVLEDGDPELFMVALRDVIVAQGGMTNMARKTKLNRESLYRMLSKHGNPEIRSLGLLAKALGWRLAFVEGRDPNLKKAA